MSSKNKGGMRINKEDYIEYDLTKVKDTKGGFFQPVDSKAVDLKFKALGKDGELRCFDCSSMGIDPVYFQIFGCRVCSKCRKENVEKYSLLTKTEVKQDYLLTEDELRDTELFKSWIKPNPRKDTWNNMLLYLRYQVEEYAFKKWDGPDGLDKEFEKRETKKRQLKNKKYKLKLNDLRKRTRTENWMENRTSNKKIDLKNHEHTFIKVSDKDNLERCSVCNLEVEAYEL